ncbi:MAG: transposase [Cytophagales bacterium]|nr:transposase [Cytophagales bacterium]
MSGDKYYISDQLAPYFLTCTVVRWIDIFSRQVYRDIVVDSLNYCIESKGLRVYAWVVMTNHIHLVCQAKEGYRISDILRDFKKFTSKKIVESIQLGPESRSEWLLDVFSFEARRTGRAEMYKLWRDDNHAIDLTHIDAMEKVNYIHMNPVRAGWALAPEHYIYSSAVDYAGRIGLVNVEVI